MNPAFDLSGYKEEIIDGKVYYMSPLASPRHGEIIVNICTIFKNYLKGKKCKVFTDTIDIFLDNKSKDVVIPDISILCDPEKFTARGYAGTPSLVVEVISPTSYHRDKNIKFSRYEKYGVQEYWLVDPNNQILEQYVLKDNQYSLEGIYTKLEDYDLERITKEERLGLVVTFVTSIFPELTINIEDVFE